MCLSVCVIIMGEMVRKRDASVSTYLRVNVMVFIFVALSEFFVHLNIWEQPDNGRCSFGSWEMFLYGS